MQGETPEYLQVKNWITMQRIDRNAPWIKVYTDLLQDHNFMSLSVDDRLAMIFIWLYVGRHGNKIINSKSFEDFLTQMFFFKNAISFERLIAAGFLEPFNEQDYLDAQLQVEKRRDQDRANKQKKPNSHFSDITLRDSDTILRNSDIQDKEEEKDEEEYIPPKTPQGGDERDEWFEEFWAAYPKVKRKTGKEIARKTFKSKVKSRSTFERVMSALSKDAASWDWRKLRGEYVPNPKPWLNKMRWLDEDVAPVKAASEWVAVFPEDVPSQVAVVEVDYAAE